MKAEAVRRSRGADGRVPRLAQRRVILFFWPTRASSANQISSGLPSASWVAISATRAGKVFKIRHRGLALGMMARASRELAVAQRPHLAAQRRLAHGHPELLPEPLDQVFQPPAHDAMDGRNGATLHQG